MFHQDSPLRAVLLSLLERGKPTESKFGKQIQVFDKSDTESGGQIVWEWAYPVWTEVISFYTSLLAVRPNTSNSMLVRLWSPRVCHLYSFVLNIYCFNLLLIVDTICNVNVG